MAQLKTETSIAVMEAIAEMLNTEIRKNGEIQINNSVIWDGYLHQMHNEDWRGILETMHTLYQQQPQLFSMQNISAITDGLELLAKYEQYYDRVMDMKNRHVSAKKTAWKCIMAVREVWNRATDEYLPNDNDSKTKTSFGSLFE